MSVSSLASVEVKEKPAGLGVRHVQALMTFLAVGLAYAMRASLSMGIVAMTTDTGHNHHYPILPWSLSQQGTILSSFFWGYLFLQVPAGNLSRRNGPKYFLFACVLGSSLLTLVIPYVALNCDWRVFCATRVLTGLIQGLLAPSCNQHTSKWAPPSERSRMFSFIFGGSVLGVMVMMLVSGYLAACAWGWPSIFYSVGGCGILWAAAWVFLGADSPDTHPHISAAERDYINSSLVDNSENSKALEVPWWEILRSVPLWALLVATLSENWGYWMLLTMIPNYMSHALNLDIESNGVLSALPYLVMYILTIVFSWTADYINAKHILSIEISRKMWNTICHWGGALSLVSMSLVSTGQGAVLLLTLAVGLNAAQFTGFLCNHLDIAPNFAGLLMGITNGCGVITSICGPLVTGLIVEDVSSKTQWMTAFYAAAASFFVGNLIFLIFGTTKIQPWNDPSKKCVELSKNEVII